MGCRRAWNDEFLDMNFTKAFRTGAYKKHREQVLVEREIAILPTRQGRVEARVKLNEVNEKVRGVNKELESLEKIRLEILRKSRRLQVKVARYTAESQGLPPPAWTLADGEVVQKKETAKFIMKCPSTDCRGFLSTAYKCGTCQKWACPDCLVIKGLEKDADHTCDPGQKESVALIIKESKGCPKCGERISKIDGCFAKNTPILMWNGSVKMSQDILVGDLLIGDDGNSRTVEKLCSGTDILYEVMQNKGMTYVVNSKHKLVLKFSGNKVIYWSNNAWKMRWFDGKKMCNKMIVTNVDDKADALKELEEFRDTLTIPDIYEIQVDDYMKLSDSTKKNLMGFKSSGVNWPKKDVVLDPYMLGLYLGDGIVDGMSFAICSEKDPEILNYILNWCEKNSSELIHDDAYRFRIRRRGAGYSGTAIGRGSTSSMCKGCLKKECSFCNLPNKSYTNNIEVASKNPFKSALETYGLLKKHIPIDYMNNDRNIRLELLAGIIDTDGYIGNDGKRIQIPQANHSLARQIEQLARSLGFIVHTDILSKKNVPFPGIGPKDYPDQLRVNISGENLSEIPTKVARKKCVSSTPNKDFLRTSIHVEEIGRGDYYGWGINNNKRFLLGDFTVARNCDQMWCIDCHTAFSWTSGQIVNGVVHNPHYYEYLRKQGNGTAPRNAGDVPCGGVPYYNHLNHAIVHILPATRRIVMQIHRITAEISDQRLAIYQGNFNVNDNGDLGVMYLLKEINKDAMQAELVKRETKRNKHLAIRAVLEMFVNTSTMMLNAMVTTPPTNDTLFSNTTLLEYSNLRTYVNDSLLNVSRMKSCSVPQISDTWSWIPFNKATPTTKRKTAVAVAVAVAADADASADAADAPIEVTQNP